MGVRDEGGSWVRGCLLELPSTREEGPSYCLAPGV
jgi:hypothetical protein